MSTEQQQIQKKRKTVRKMVDPPIAYCGEHFESEIDSALTKLQFGQELSIRKAPTRPTQAKCPKDQRDALYTLCKVVLLKLDA